LNALALMYHDVVEHGGEAASGFIGRAATAYKVEGADFAKHLDAIERALAGTPPALVSHVYGWKTERPVFLTFDDGGVSAYTTIAPLLEERCWRAHFLIPTSYIGRPGFLNPDQIRVLHSHGHAIGSHSSSHPAWMASCDANDLAREWTTSAQILSEILGEPARIASVPGGDYSRRVGAVVARSGFEVLFTSAPTTRVGRIEDCLVVGRYAIRRGMGPAVPAALVAGNLWPRLKQSIIWRAKRAVKSAGRPLLRHTALGGTSSGSSS
jgi:peptidoglycan/xylan/chitin deacetylase (PgdA/CDA1 family)